MNNHCAHIVYKITFKWLALNQIQVISLLQNTTFKATAQSFQISTIDVEHKPRHYANLSSFFLLLLEFPLDKLSRAQKNGSYDGNLFHTANYVVSGWNQLGRQSVIWLAMRKKSISFHANTCNDVCFDGVSWMWWVWLCVCCDNSSLWNRNYFDVDSSNER